MNGFGRTARVSRSQLEDYSQSAVRSYLEDRTPLNDSIYKIASQNSLNTESVRRVCEMANVAVEGELFNAFQKIARQKVAEEKIYYPKFATADAKTVIAKLGKTEKLASFDIALSDYDMAIPNEIKLGYDKSANAAIEKLAFQVKAEPRFGEALERLEALRIETIFGKTASELRIEECAHTCYKHIKQQVLKGADLKSIYKAALKKKSSQEDKNRVKDLFQFAASKLVDEGVVITTDRQAVKLAYAPLSKEEVDEYVTDLFEMPEGAGLPLMLNGSYVNDEHPLFSELDILVQQYDSSDRYDRALVVIDDKIKYVKRKIRGESVGGA